ncbi:thioesterase [Polaribacter reichenbachii]|uniref:Thioesterase n=1 Tax=Polaribacter reichenbachii TaxID=996801 RepID=A0A1B8U594_9FLAO|nr:thioesterase family protein [Polaribacter reichenbachii]APZ47621.1 thioesterase [Polaribacter reichenbachii]AUC18261.1 thioesterase [Polaribacter reichenbachii]OBY67026.1 thioesterase [Polaribacter reichenbachii]
MNKLENVFTLKITVSAEDIDNLQHVNNLVYVKWMDKIATTHWSFLTKENPLPQYVWVVIRHEIDYLKQAGLGDEITVKTWVGETKGITSIRFMEFYKGNVLLVKAKTTWAMLNAKTFKPTRIREDVLKVLQN